MEIGPLKSITRIYANVYIKHGYRSFEVNNPDLCQHLHRTRLSFEVFSLGKTLDLVFWTKIFFLTFGPNFFSDQILFGTNIFCGPIFFLGPKFIWIVILDQKVFINKIFFRPKLFWTNIFFGPIFFFGPNFFFQTKIFLDIIIFFRTKTLILDQIFLNQQFYWDQLFFSY